MGQQPWGKSQSRLPLPSSAALHVHLLPRFWGEPESSMTRQMCARAMCAWRGICRDVRGLCVVPAACRTEEPAWSHGALLQHC